MAQNATQDDDAQATTTVYLQDTSGLPSTARFSPSADYVAQDSDELHEY